ERADDHRDPIEAGLLRGAPASFAGDDLEALTVGAYDDWFNDAVRADRLRQLVESRFAELRPRLARVGRDPVDVDFERRPARDLWEIRNQCAEAFAESGPFFHDLVHALSADVTVTNTMKRNRHRASEPQRWRAWEGDRNLR